MEKLALAGVLTAGYCIGSIPFTLIEPLFKGKIAIIGKILAFLFNMTKPVMAVLLAYIWIGSNFRDDLYFIMIFTLPAILGHFFPVYTGFKGPRDGAVSAGIFFFIAPFYAVAGHLVYAVAFIFKGEKRSKALQLCSLIAIPVSGAFFILADLIGWTTFGWSFSVYFPPIIGLTKIVFFFSLVHAGMLYIGRILTADSFTAIKSSSSKIKTALLRGLFF
jgi:glycerol-3-phosphate acyltransferase PlsY